MSFSFTHRHEFFPIHDFKNFLLYRRYLELAGSSWCLLQSSGFPPELTVRLPVCSRACMKSFDEMFVFLSFCCAERGVTEKHFFLAKILS